MGLSGVMLNKTDIIQSAQFNGGIVRYMAEALDCSRDAIYDWMHRDEEVKECITLARNRRQYHIDELDIELIDASYAGIKRLIEADHAGCITFTLERKGGWTKKEMQQAVQQLTYVVNNPTEALNDKPSNPITILSATVSDANTNSAEEGSKESGMGST